MDAAALRAEVERCRARRSHPRRQAPGRPVPQSQGPHARAEEAQPRACWHCRDCGMRVQGRHRLQTSDATGAAAAQLDPDAPAAMPLLNKEMGLSLGKVARFVQAPFGIHLTRRAGSKRADIRAANLLATRPSSAPLALSRPVRPDAAGLAAPGTVNTHFLSLLRCPLQFTIGAHPALHLGRLCSI